MTRQSEHRTGFQAAIHGTGGCADTGTDPAREGNRGAPVGSPDWVRADLHDAGAGVATGTNLRRERIFDTPTGSPNWIGKGLPRFGGGVTLVPAW